MYSEDMDEVAICNTSDLNEELGQVRFIVLNFINGFDIN